MIAVDTSSLRRFLSGDKGVDVDRVADALEHRNVVLPPVVLTEMLSDPAVGRQTERALSGVPLLEIREGYWIRAALLRRQLLGQGLKSRIADALIAQSCLDHNVALITHDRDFRHYAAHGLILM